MGFKWNDHIEGDVAHQPDPKDPYKNLMREAEQFDFDVGEQMADSLYANLSWNQIQRYASQLDIEVDEWGRANLCEALADRGVFFGPVGDSTVYIREDGVTRKLEDYLAEQYTEDDGLPWE